MQKKFYYMLSLINLIETQRLIKRFVHKFVKNVFSVYLYNAIPRRHFFSYSMSYFSTKMSELWGFMQNPYAAHHKLYIKLYFIILLFQTKL